jgi:RNA polymerase sigma factor (sigma-70 family)
MTTTSLARQLGALFEGGSAAGLSDRQLLERFACSRNEAAFAAIVARHGPMVLGVCRQLLGDHHHAEDAFQAVFLVLARQVRSIRDPDSLGPWLYGVALRTARKARTRLARRRQTEEEGAMSRPEAGPSSPADRDLLDRERSEALHGEIDRLPGAFRAPMVLCYFEGLTLDEAAHRLRWPVGTLRSRLARARDKLRRGLTRRGVAISTTALGAALAPRSASASVSPLLCDSTTKAAIHFAAGHAAGGALSAHAAAAAREVARTMLFHKFKAAAISLVLLAMIAAGTGYYALNALAGPGEGALHPSRERERAVTPAAGALPLPDGRGSERRPSPDPAAARMSIVGRVIDPSGKPLPGARVAVLADRKRRVSDLDGQPPNILMGTAAADTDGRFTLAFPAIPARDLYDLRLMAVAPGRGLGVVELKTDAANQETSIALPPEQPIEGRLVDIQGQPAAGVVVRVAGLRVRGGRGQVQPYDAKGSPSLWPAPATTDADGRFRVLGLGHNAPATFEVEDPRFARQAFSFEVTAIPAVPGRPGEKIRPSTTVTLRPAQALDFHVVHADDGHPAAGARIEIQSMQTPNRRRGITGPTDARVDDQGHARVVPWPGDRFLIGIHPPEGEPYLPAQLDANWPKGAVRHPVEVKLQRGVVVRGRLVEDPAGTPVGGGWVGYLQTRRGNPRPLRLPAIQAVSGPDGTFTLIVPTGPGHLLVQGPSADYLHVSTSNVEMGSRIGPSFHMYPDAHAVLDIKDGEAMHPVELRLRRGVTVAGSVVGPNGQPVAEAFAFGRSYVPYGERAYPMSLGAGSPPQIEVKDGRFEIPGCDPEKLVTFYFLDVKDHLGGTAEISGRLAANGPITVRLRPTASASIRLKRPDDKVPDYYEARGQLAGLRLVITPGPDIEEMNTNIFNVIPGDFATQINLDFDPDHLPQPGLDGRITLRNLIPGATYRFRGREFTPEPGQTVDLGEVVVEPRRR